MTTPQRCSRCLLYAGMRFHLLPRQLDPAVTRAFFIGDDGICSVCKTYASRLDRKRIDAELASFILNHTAPGAPPAIVALSGGKDSICALVTCVRRLQLPTIAMLYDNGFIPPEVIAQAARVCEALETPFEIVRPSPDEAQAFDRLVEGATSQVATPCAACSASIFRALDARADVLGSRWLVLGTNYHAAWSEPLSAVNVRKTAGGRVIRRIHLPFAMSLTHDTLLETLDELGVVVHKQRGASSNCRVPELVQARVAPTLGHPTELEDLALEVMAGHLRREAALDELARIEGRSNR